MKLDVALCWHVHPWETLLRLVRRAETLGYPAAFVDGDVSMLGVRPDADALDGWTVTMALLAHTERIAIGSMRLAHHWNAAHLAQSAATAERLYPGRLRFLISIGDWPIDARFGLPRMATSERIALLDEMLTALRGLWRGESVSLDGRYVKLDRARVRPTPPGGRIPIAIAAQGRRMLEVVAAHADVWDINLPPIPHRVRAAEANLEGACARRGRDPSAIERSMWIFARVDSAPDPLAALKQYRSLNPWFHWIPDAEIRASLIVGRAADCRRRLAEVAGELGLDRPVLDLSGLAAEAAEQTLEALAPNE